MTMKALVFPGQGAQVRGMGRELFDAWPEFTAEADHLLGYSIRELCLEDPHQRLGHTEFTQPALFVVGALAYQRWLDQHGEPPAFFAGHSLGEFTALYAAGAFDFATGLRLVQRRGCLMAQAGAGGMAAVVGIDARRLREVLGEGGFDTLTIANDNAPTQQVVSGDVDTIRALATFLGARGIRCAKLNVSGAFHSPYMRPVREAFADFLRGFTLADPRTPVIANVTARPHQAGEVGRLLTEQIVSPVRWTDSVRHLLDQGVTEFVELGGKVLTKLIDKIREPAPLGSDLPGPRPAVDSPAASLGSSVFRERMGLRYAYAVGSMYRGIASPEMVIRLGRSGMLGFLGTGGMPLGDIEQGVRTIQRGLDEGQTYGVNLLANHDDPEAERAVVELLMRQGVRVLEASAFMQMTASLVLFRAGGMRRGQNGEPLCDNRIIAKVSRPEVARTFMAPAPDAVLERLVAEGAVTAEQAELARLVPMSHDITVEADSGGHTDGGIATVMMPAMIKLRQEAQQRYGYLEPLCLGLAGGLGTPAAVAAAFMLGADYVLTGSINQCTVESGMSAVVKDILQEIDIYDTDYAPAGDMFELGAKVQVLRKGVFFPTRANKLFLLYTHYDSLDDMPAKTRALLEKSYFRKSIDEVWEETCGYFRARGREEVITRANAQPKLKMSLVFRWYFSYTARLALTGLADDRVNYQVHTGPALGAFNQWVKGTAHESWRERHVDKIGLMLLDAAAQYIDSTYRRWRADSWLAADRRPDPAAPGLIGSGVR